MCEEIDSLSDHKLIEIRLSASNESQRSSSTRLFATRPADLSSLFSAAAKRMTSITAEPRTRCIVDNFNECIMRVCSDTLPKRRTPKADRSLLWWDKDVRETRVLKNRAIKAFNQTKGRDPNSRKLAKERMISAKKNYRKLVITKDKENTGTPLQSL